MSSDAHPFSDAAAAAMLDDVMGSLEDGDEKPGDVIGPYRLMDKLGEGGFGIVWRAEQAEPVRREVALKLLKRGMDSCQILARFEQERRMLAAMEHPCIATMYDAGVSPDGRPFFVMELLRGLPITTYCEKNALPLREKIALFREVCGGVQHAHQKGVIHRDLKPSNILVTEVDGHPVPKIIDFGIAKALGSGGLYAMTFVTQGNFILGTPQYMSPEQIADVGAVDTRSDIYALGTLLYELLTGGPPFDPRTLVEKGPQEFRRIIREQQPRRPSTAMTTRVVTLLPSEARPDASRLPPDLDWITLQALEKEPQRRYQSAAEFAADLQRFLDDEPVSAHPPSTAYIARRWIKRHRTAFVAACACVLALLAGTGVALWQARLARQAQQRAEAESMRSHETASFLNGMLAKVAEEVRKGRNPEALRLALISSENRIDAMCQDPALQLSLMTQIADLYNVMSERRLAEEALRKSALLSATLHGPDSAAARTTQFRYLLVVIDQGDRVKGLQELTGLRTRIERQEGRGSESWFQVQHLIVRVLIKLRRGDEAALAAQDTTTEARRWQLDANRMHTILMQHAEALESAGRFDDAIAVALECRPQAGTHASSPCAMTEIEQKIVRIEMKRGDYTRAAELQSACIARLRADEEKDQAHVIGPLLLLCEIEILAKRYESAIHHAWEACDLALAHTATVPEAGGSADSLREQRVKALGIQATGHSGLRQHDQALAAAREALRVAHRGGNHTLISRALTTLAGAHEAAGRLDDAWDAHQEKYELHAAHNASHKNRLDDLREMSRIRLRQNRPEDALGHAMDAWRQALAEPSAHLEPDYLAYIAAPAIQAWKAVQTATPHATPPKELQEWKLAVANDPSRGS